MSPCGVQRQSCSRAQRGNLSGASIELVSGLILQHDGVVDLADHPLMLRLIALELLVGLIETLCSSARCPSSETAWLIDSSL
jgi:hypothetical protein